MASGHGPYYSGDARIYSPRTDCRREIPLSHAAGNGKLKAIQRADVNRARKIQSLREWTRLLAEAVNPEFTGKIAIEIPVLNGNLGQLVVTCVRRPAD